MPGLSPGAYRILGKMTLVSAVLTTLKICGLAAKRLPELGFGPAITALDYGKPKKILNRVMGPPLLPSESLVRIFGFGLTQQFFLASAE